MLIYYIKCQFVTHSEDLATHRLAILSNFSETAEPTDYSCLLPEICDEGVLELRGEGWGELDWVAADEVS